MIVGRNGDDPGTWCISSMMWLLGPEEQRAFPERSACLADEGAAEEKAGEERAAASTSSGTSITSGDSCGVWSWPPCP